LRSRETRRSKVTRSSGVRDRAGKGGAALDELPDGAGAALLAFRA